jgi:hypothetical protein
MLRNVGWTASPLTMGPIRSSETSVRNQPTLRKMPGEDRIQGSSFQSPGQEPVKQFCVGFRVASCGRMEDVVVKVAECVNFSL